MQRNPNYFFKGRSATGIFDVPIESMIIIDQPEEHSIPGDLRIVIKIGNGSMVPTSNIGEFMDDTSLWREGIGQSGRDGTDGKDGKDGRDGVDGDDGLDGADGAAGPRGKKGDRGIQGIGGLDGNDGNDGVDGVDGINGSNGADGADGKEGPRGPTGPRGIQGPQGTDGTDGTDGAGVVIKGTQSVSDILALPNPSVGDMWIANNTDTSSSIHGVAGDGFVCAEITPSIVWENVGPIRGPRGHVGAHGSHGVDGKDGTDGGFGKNGATGPAGKTGPRGVRGAIGPKGDRGASGFTYSDLELLEKIKKVDGTGSGLDADLIDGKDISYFSPSGHKHPMSDVNGLTQSLASKAPLGHSHALLSHKHPISEVNGLNSELARKLEANNYATNTRGGTVKMRLSGSTLYLTNDGSNA